MFEGYFFDVSLNESLVFYEDRIDEASRGIYEFIKHPRRRIEYLLSRVYLQMIAEEFHDSKNYTYSLSHTCNLAILCYRLPREEEHSPSASIGVDLESLSRQVSFLKRSRYLSPQEHAFCSNRCGEIEGRRYLFLWCLKEAFIKYHAKSVLLGKKISVVLDNRRMLFKIECDQLLFFCLRVYKGSLAVTALDSLDQTPFMYFIDINQRKCHRHQLKGNAFLYLAVGKDYSIFELDDFLRTLS